MNEYSVHYPLLTIFGLAVLFLGLKALVLGAATAATRGRIKQFINAEDAAWLKGTHVELDSEAVARIGRAHRNDLENLLVFAIAGAIYLAAGASEIAGIIYSGFYVVARLLHTFAYLSGRPLLRRNAYTLGFFVIAVMAVHAAVVLIIN
ncbi:MAPEG family protein [Ciceribacter ferrooxidans]|uniref:Microsomal glutathione S-transferase 1 n=1 Tax=Ciceribacter ferrooxidans TaxID=2509717 RepID=A0A4V1RQT8_9HYPH|nr:MAPEG family protein [Ciceribacter ferrooxidans]RYC14007.1 MAPEG family protein [Ciceribacter ferrooxidans]